MTHSDILLYIEERTQADSVENQMCSKTKCKSCFTPFKHKYGCKAHDITKTIAELANHMNNRHCVEQTTTTVKWGLPVWMTVEPEEQAGNLGCRDE